MFHRYAANFFSRRLYWKLWLSSRWSPYALKLPSQAQPEIRAANQAHEGQRRRGRNCDHDGTAAVKVAPAARRFAAQ
jgi:hypothetical protein